MMILIYVQIISFFWTVGALTSWRLGPSDTILLLSQRFLALWYARMFQAHLVFFLPKTCNQPFLQKPWSSLMGNDVSQPQSGCQVSSFPLGWSLFLGLCSEQSWGRCPAHRLQDVHLTFLVLGLCLCLRVLVLKDMGGESLVLSLVTPLLHSHCTHLSLRVTVAVSLLKTGWCFLPKTSHCLPILLCSDSGSTCKRGSHCLLCSLPETLTQSQSCEEVYTEHSHRPFISVSLDFLVEVLSLVDFSEGLRKNIS